MAQAISDLEHDILHNDKNDDESGGDSDYETEQGGGKGESKPKPELSKPSGNIIIKKNPNKGPGNGRKK